MCVLVYGDDFFVVGRSAGREFTLRLLMTHYEMSKVTTFGPHDDDVKEARFLNRRICYRSWG